MNPIAPIFLPADNSCPSDACLFTLAPLAQDQTEEHVVPRSIGGRITSRLVVSGAFNKSAGQDLDPDLARCYAPVMNLLAPVLPESVSKPSIHFELAGRSYKLEPGGRTELAKPLIIKNAQGGISQVAANDRSGVERWAERSKRKVDPKKSFIVPSSEGGVADMGPQVSYSPDIGRAALKVALVVADHSFRARGSDSPIRHPAFLTHRRIVHEGFGYEPANRVLSTGVVRPDLRPDLIKCFRDIASRDFHPFSHTLFLCFDEPSGLIHVILCLFGYDVYIYTIEEAPIQRSGLVVAEACPLATHEPYRVWESHELCELITMLRAPGSITEGFRSERFAAAHKALLEEADEYVQIHAPTESLRDIASEALFQHKEAQIPIGRAFLSSIRERTMRFYYHHKPAFQQEWPGISSDFEKLFMQKLEALKPDDFQPDGQCTEAALSCIQNAYVDLFKRCSHHIGQPTRLAYFRVGREEWKPSSPQSRGSRRHRNK